MEYSKKRVSKACDTCRTRKLKCDALRPKCTRCRTSDSICVYTAKERTRKTVVKIAKKPISLNGLDERMGRLESMIGSLVTKLDPSAVHPPEIVENNDQSPTSDGTAQDEVEADPSPRSPVLLDPNSDGDAPVEKYFGTQSSFSMLSAKGIQWLEKFCGDKGLFDRFQTFHQKTTAAFLMNNKMWLDPIEKAELKPIPPRHVTDPLVEVFSSELVIVEMFMPTEQIHSLFNRYYELVDSPNKVTKKRLTNSDLLSINAILALASTIAMDPGQMKDKATIDNLLQLQLNHTENAIFYFHRVATISEGIRTIQALMIMVMFSEFTKCAPQTYILVSTLVRYAQDMGLHRRESLFGLPEKEAMMRRRLWICVSIFDRDTCFRSGKPPIINQNDVSSVVPSQYSEVFFYNIDPYTVKCVLDPEFDVVTTVKDMTCIEYKDSPVRCLLMNFYAHIVNFTGTAYDKLFSASSFEGMCLDEVLYTIASVDNELDELIMNLPASARPGSDVSQISAPPIRYDIWLTHMQYYSSRMIINKMAFTRTWMHSTETSEDWNRLRPLQRKLMIKCLDSARKIMRTIADEEHANPIFSNQASFQFISAFFTLFNGIIEYPKAPFVKDDLIIITEVRNKLLAENALHGKNSGEEFVSTIVNYTVRFFMRIAMIVYNNTHDDQMDVTGIELELAECDTRISKMSAVYSRNIKLTDPLVTILKNSGKPVPDIAKSYAPPSHMFVGPSRASIPMIMNPADDFGKHTSSFSDRTSPRDSSCRDGAPTSLNTGLSEGYSPTFPDLGDFQSVDDLGVNQYTLEDFESEKNSSILQQLFAIPSVYLSTNEPDGFGFNPNNIF